jgi:prolyl oligopeptidase
MLLNSTSSALSRRFWLLLVSLFAALWLVACANTSVGVGADSGRPAISYPTTRTVDHVDTYHGTRVADPYRWLEDDNSAQTKAWVQAQNEVTERFLGAMPQRAPVRKLYTDLYNYEKFGLPFKEGGRYFWSHNDGLQQQSVIYTAMSLNEAPQIALDPHGFSKDGTVALTGTVPSRDGKLLAYGTAVGGSDWQTWRVRDLATGKDRPDTVEWVKFSSAVWTPDHQGFFYARYDAPKAGETLTATNVFQKLYYHRLGTAQADDVLVMANPAEKSWGFGTGVSSDGRWVIINVWQGGRKNGLMFLPLNKGTFIAAKAEPITLAFDAEYAAIDVVADKLWLRTDKDAPRGRVLSIDLLAPTQTAWKTLVAEGPDTMSSASVVGGKLVLRYLRDAASLVRVHNANGSLLREVQLPGSGVGSASGFANNGVDSETFFSYTSLITPTEVWRYDVATGEATIFKRPNTAFDATQFETRRAFITSKDGTRVPLFIAHRKGLQLDGNNPTLLYGYGGFGVSQTPNYNVTAASWMKMGGVYVLAAIRGGGEYGSAWHDAGTKLQKQNVFDDFIAAAEWLITNKITTSKKLAVMGGSNGGLLVGAVVNQRPDLFGAALPAVGVMDMLRFHKFTIGWAWVSDYGSSDDAAQFAALKAYSPLHNIAGGKNYPAVLVTTADRDDRVVPAHSFKYTSALQAANTGNAPKLIRIETQAGHGAGKPTNKIIEERADMLAFVAHAFGVAVN